MGNCLHLYNSRLWSQTLKFQKTALSQYQKKIFKFLYGGKIEKYVHHPLARKCCNRKGPSYLIIIMWSGKEKLWQVEDHFEKMYSHILLLLNWVYPWKVVPLKLAKASVLSNCRFDINFSRLQLHNLLKLLKDEVIYYHAIKARMFLYFHLLLPHSHFTENLFHCIFFL